MSYDRPRPGGSSLPPPTQPRPRRAGEAWTDAPVSQPDYRNPDPHTSQPHLATARPRPGDGWVMAEAAQNPRTDFGESDGATQYDSDLHAGFATSRTKPKAGAGPIVPAGSVTSNSLTLVISIMCFLACLTAGAVYLVNQSASAWLNDIASEVTVQIEPREKADTDKLVRDVSAFLAKQPGIRIVKPLSLEDSTALVEPWLGQSEGLKALPMPRLIALEVDRANPPDFTALRGALAAQFPKGVIIDDHRQWQQQIRTVTRSLALGGLAIFLLVASATILIIVSAARSAMASNREIVEVLHFVGATDRFIAGEFERHFQRLGIRAGLMGAFFAVLVFLGMPTIMELLGGGAVTVAELQRLIGSGTLDWIGHGVLVVVVIVIAVLCRMTSRFGVFRILNSKL